MVADIGLETHNRGGDQKAVEVHNQVTELVVGEELFHFLWLPFAWQLVKDNLILVVDIVVFVFVLYLDDPVLVLSDEAVLLH